MTHDSKEKPTCLRANARLGSTPAEKTAGNLVRAAPHGGREHPECPLAAGPPGDHAFRVIKR
jgi:hypothetical protein